MDELSNIKAFIAVVEAGSFSASSRIQGVSVSTVARQVKALEDELGVRLLHRNTRSHSLTQAGELFYKRVTHLNREFASAKAEVMAHNANLTGTVRVSLRNPVATTLIIPALERFQEEYPDITLDISISDEHKDLIASEIDVAIWLGVLEDSDFVVRQLSPSQRIICGSRSYFEKHGMPQTPSELEVHNCLRYRQHYYDNCWYFYRQGVEERITVSGKILSDDGLVLLTAALSNLGIIMINERAVRKYLANGDLVRILSEYEVKPIKTPAPLFVVYPSRDGLSKKVRIFIDFLVSVFSEKSNAP